MDLPPLTPPSLPSADPNQDPVQAPVDPTASPSLSDTPPAPTSLPPVSQPVAAVGPSESQSVSPAAEAPFTPTSPILAGLQGMSSQPFQDPGGTPVVANAGLSGPAASPISSAGTVQESSVPQESGSSGLAASPSALPPGFGVPASQTSPSTSVPPPEPPGDTKSSAKSQKQPPDSGRKLLGFLGGIGGKRLIPILAVVVLLVIGIAAAAFFLNRPASNSGTQTPAAKTTITYWGLWEPQEVMEPLIQQYEGLNQGIDIVYQQQSSQQYRARMQTAVRNGTGPDIFRYHNTWLPMVKDDLAPAPRSVLPATELQQAYYPIMAEELVQNSQVVGVPLMFEGMALLYNESMLEAAAALPPKNWQEVRELAARLAIKSGNNNTLDRGGIALGTANNVDNSSDILALMMLQNSATPGNPMSANSQTALQFYTLFTRSDGVWSASMPQSTLAFANEKVAMILVPSWRIHEIRRLNPNLRFGVTRLPQLSDDRITWGSYWVEGVNKNSKNTEAAWKFLGWLSQPEQLRRLYSEAVKYRGFGELYPRVEMASELDDPIIQPYLEDALYAKSWPLASMTHDEGINDQMIQYYTDAINQMNRSGNAEAALQTIVPGIQQVLSKYGMSVSR